MGTTCSLPNQDLATTNFTDPNFPPDSTPRNNFFKQVSVGPTTDCNLLTQTRYDDNFDIDEENPVSSITNFMVKSKLIHYLEDTQSSFFDQDDHLEMGKSQLTFAPEVNPQKSMLSYFSRGSSLRQQPSNGDTVIDLWALEDIRLNHLISKSDREYIWEAENIILNKTCAVRIILTEVSNLLHYNFTATKEVLESLMSCSNPDMMQIYSFAIWKTEDHLVVIIVQEPIHCRLVDYFDQKVRKGEDFSELEILQIMGDIYYRLESCRNEGLKVQDVAFDNIFLSKGNYQLKLSDIDLAIPLLSTSKAFKDDKTFQLEAKKSQFLIESQDSDLGSLDEDLHIKIIATLAYKLMVKRRDTNISVNAVEKNKELQKKYSHLFYLLSLRWDHKSFLETLLNLYRHHNFKNQSRVAEQVHNIGHQRETYETVECLLDKDLGYTLLGNHAAAKQVCLEAKTLLENKKGKGTGEYFMLIKCFNNLLSHCIQLNDLTLAEALSNKMVSAVQNDTSLSHVILNQPNEYYAYLFTQARGQEARGNKLQAQQMYQKVLVRCEELSIVPKGYVAALNAIFKISSTEPDQNRNLKYYNMLKTYYCGKRGFYLEKAVIYDSIGDILAGQQRHGAAVRNYVQALEMYGKMEINQNLNQIEILDKIIDEYVKLDEHETSLSYMFRRNILKVKVYGRLSNEYNDDLREICDLFVRIEDYDSALKYYLNYKNLIEKIEGSSSEKYLQALIYMSEIYVKLNKYRQALELLKEYRETKTQTHELSDLKMLRLIDRIANVLFKQGVYRESLKLQLKHLPIKQKLYGETSKYYLVSLNNIGDTYFMIQDYENALQYHTKCFQAFKGGLEKRFLQDWRKVVLNIAYDHEKLKNHAKAFEFLFQNLKTSKLTCVLNIEVIAEEYEALDSYKKKDLLSLNFNDVTIETKVSYS